MRNSEGVPIYFELEDKGQSGTSATNKASPEGKDGKRRGRFYEIIDQDLARLHTFLIPGVVNGTVLTILANGDVREINFDVRDNRGLPTAWEYTPEAPIPTLSSDITIK